MADELTRAELLKALDSEINQIENATKRPGWSSWALGGGIGSLLWLALNNYSNTSSPQSIAIIFIFGSLFLDFIVAAWIWLNTLETSKQNHNRYIFAKDNTNIAPSKLIFQIIRAILMLSLCRYLELGYWTASLQLYFWSIIIICTLGLYLRQKNALSKTRPNQTGLSNLIFLLYVLWNLLLLFLTFTVVPPLPTSIQDYRIGLLLAVTLQLASFLVIEVKEQPAIKALKSIRRELAFGQIGTNDAARMSDQIIFGLSQEDTIKHYILNAEQEVLRSISSYEALTIKCQAIQNEIAQLEESESKSSSWKDHARAVTLKIDKLAIEIEVCGRDAWQISNKSFKTLQFTTSKEMRPIKWIEEILSIYNRLRDRSLKLIESVQITNKTFEEIKQRYNILESK